MLKLSNENISRLYLGNTEIVKAYMGSDLVFSKTKTYTVSASIDPAGSGTVTGAGQYQEGAEVTITATPAEGYTFSGWQEAKPLTLPTGYTLLEYIESSGTQYINTGIAPTTNTKVDTDIYMPQVTSITVSVFGNYIKSGSTFIMFRALEDNTGVVRFNLGTEQKNTNNALSVGRHIISLDAQKKQGRYDDEIISFNAPTSLPTSNIILFASNNDGTIGNYSSIRLYSCQIYEGNTCVRNFVPCISPSGAVGLYDLAHSVFYGNSGTGTFAAGPETEGTITEIVSESATYTFTVTGNRALTAVFAVAKPSRLPAGYTEVEYIHSDSACCIETGINALSYARIKVEVDIQADAYDTSKTDAEDIFSALYLKTTSASYYFYICRASESTIRYRFYTNSVQSKSLSISGKRIIVSYDGPGKKITIGDNVFTHSITSTYSLNKPLCLFAPGGADGTDRSIRAKLYSAKVYNKDTLQADFVPCTNPSGVVGVYDLVGNNFYSNSRTGILTAGPAV